MLFSPLLIFILLTSACTGIQSSAVTQPVTLPVSTAITPAPSGITIHRTVSDMDRMDCPCFTLVTGTGNVVVWYDLMVSPDGTRMPGVPVEDLADGMEIWVTGMLQDTGKFPATAIRTSRP